MKIESAVRDTTFAHDDLQGSDEHVIEFSVNRALFKEVKNA